MQTSGVRLAALTVVALWVAACSSGNPDSVATGATGSEGNSLPVVTESASASIPATTIAGTAQTSDPAPEVALSPLMRFWRVSDDPLELREAAIARERRQQAEIVDCMAAEGWTYYAIYATEARFAAMDSAEDSGNDIEEGEFNPHGGYGVAIGYEGDLESEGTRFQVVNRNDEVLAGLSEEEIRAWAESQNRCVDTVVAAEQTAPLTIPDELQAPLAAIDEQVQSDPRYVQAWDEWARCLASEGFDYPTRDLIVADLEEMMAPIYEAAPGEGSEIPEELRPLFDRIKTLEQEIADVDAECSKAVAEVERDLRWEYEVLFIEEHYDLLSLVRDEFDRERD